MFSGVQCRSLSREEDNAVLMKILGYDVGLGGFLPFSYWLLRGYSGIESTEEKSDFRFEAYLVFSSRALPAWNNVSRQSRESWT
jgi:hypothetical protein